MKIAIDISPLKSGHKVRGVGFYVLHLKDALLKYFPEHEYILFTEENEVPKDIDIVHYPYFDPFFSTLPLKKKHKTIVTVHDFTPLVFPEHFPAGIKGSLRWQVQKLKLHQVSAVIVDSLCSQKDVVKIGGINNSKVAVVYLAAGEEFKQITNYELRIMNIRKTYSLPERFVLYVGDVTWNKNVPRIMEAAINLNIPLVMVGRALTEKNFDRTNPWNKDRITVQSLAKDHKNIIQLGFIPTEDIVGLYNTATVFIFPSLYEGFGLPVIEAMSCGCPVITSKEGSLPEVAGDAAYFVNAYSAENIANGITGVFTNKKLQKELSEKGIEQAKKFSWKMTAQETINVYKKVLS